VKTIALFNNKGGVGKTSLVYHLAWMFAELRLRVVAVDLDPQANLSSFFLPEDPLVELWESSPARTIYGALVPLFKGTGDVQSPFLNRAAPNVGVVAGDLDLSSIEDDLSVQWSRCLDGDERAFRVTSAFARAIAMAAESDEADVVLIDVGPNLGALNRSALIACDAVVVPLGPDLFSLRGLINMGPRLRRWRGEWHDRLRKAEGIDLRLPSGRMRPVGYVVARHSVRLDRPVQAYARWIAQMPGEYRRSVLQEEGGSPVFIDRDPNCLAQLKDYRSLMPMAQESNRPMFKLKPADGAIGGHQQAVLACYRDFEALARKIAERCDVAIPAGS